MVAAVLLGAAAFVGARSMACCAGGCPYQEAMEAPSAGEALVGAADTGGCPHARR